MSQKRISWVDYAKAISILGIIIGHFAPYFSQVIPWAHPLCELMYSFHVAAFFLLSGYTTKPGIMPARKVASFAKTCFLPYIVAGALSAIVCMLFTPNKSIIEWGAALVYASGAYNGELLGGFPFGAVVIGAVWFLPALFFGKIISTLISKFPIVVRLLIAAVLFVIGMETAKILFLPMDIQQALCASWWITCGMILSQSKVLEKSSTISTVIIGIVATLGVFYMSVLWLELWREPMYCNSTYHNGVLDMLGTTFATIAIILLAKLIEKTPHAIQICANWIGRNTLPIFCWHAVSIAPGVFLSDWLLSFVENGVPAIAVFFISLFADIAFAFGMTWVSSKVPGLRTVFFPHSKTVSPAVQLVGHDKNEAGKSSTISTSMENTLDFASRDVNDPPVMVHRTGNKKGSLSITPPQANQEGPFHMSNAVSQTDKTAEEVILDAKRTMGYTPPEHKTKKRRTNGGHLRIKTKANPSRHLER